MVSSVRCYFTLSDVSESRLLLQEHGINFCAFVVNFSRYSKGN
jgi:hypothetical protein